MKHVFRHRKWKHLEIIVTGKVSVAKAREHLILGLRNPDMWDYTDMWDYIEGRS